MVIEVRKYITSDGTEWAASSLADLHEKYLHLREEDHHFNMVCHDIESAAGPDVDQKELASLIRRLVLNKYFLSSLQQIKESTLEKLL